MPNDTIFANENRANAPLRPQSSEVFSIDRYTTSITLTPEEKRRRNAQKKNQLNTIAEQGRRYATELANVHQKYEQERRVDLSPEQVATLVYHADLYGQHVNHWRDNLVGGAN